MNDTFHIITTWSSSLIILIMGGLLLTVGITSKSQWKHLRYGCFCLSISYFILGMASLAESIIELSGHLIPMKSQLVLAVSFFQAMLFTGTSLVLIRPQLLELKVFKLQLYLIIPLLTIFGISYLMKPAIHSILFYLTVSAYVIQLLYNTLIFSRTYYQVLHQTDSSTPEGTTRRIHYTKKLFYASLGVGITALVYTLSPFNRSVEEFFTITYTIYYVILVFFLVSCSRKNEYALKAVDQPAEAVPSSTDDTTSNPVPTAETIQPDNVPSENKPSENDPSTNTIADNTQPDSALTETIEDVTNSSSAKPETRAEKRLTAALEEWVKNERYLCPDVPLEEVANELNTDVDSLHDYFLSRKGILFRTWRVMLRIEKAKKLLELNPKIKISELQTKVGFSDKSYFFRRFKQVTGKTPNEYRNDLQK